MYCSVFTSCSVPRAHTHAQSKARAKLYNDGQKMAPPGIQPRGYGRLRTHVSTHCRRLLRRVPFPLVEADLKRKEKKKGTLTKGREEPLLTRTKKVFSPSFLLLPSFAGWGFQLMLGSTTSSASTPTFSPWYERAHGHLCARFSPREH